MLSAAIKFGIMLCIIMLSIFVLNVIMLNVTKEVDCSRHIISQKSPFTNQERWHWAQTRQAGYRRANKAGGLGQAGGLTRQACQVNECAWFNCQYFCGGH
jgi:hypothetical protein